MMLVVKGDYFMHTCKRVAAKRRTRHGERRGLVFVQSRAKHSFARAANKRTGHRERRGLVLVQNRATLFSRGKPNQTTRGETDRRGERRGLVLPHWPPRQMSRPPSAAGVQWTPTSMLLLPRRRGACKAPHSACNPNTKRSFVPE